MSPFGALRRRWTAAVGPRGLACRLSRTRRLHRARAAAADDDGRSEVLRERERQLLEVRRMETVGRMASSVAHDFNNLLAVVSGNAEALLARREFDEHALGEIRAASEQAARLVRQLMAFARKQASAPQLVSLDDVLAELQPILRRLVGNAVEVRWERASALPQLKVCPTQLEQLILNLAVNARDAMPEGGTLTIATAANGSQEVVLRVCDTGIGIDETVRASMFEPFFTTKAASGGTGLGLSTVRAIVTEAGGSIRVETEVGRGSMFEVVLPAAASS
jgi:signal transduction histidine kinase